MSVSNPPRPPKNLWHRLLRGKLPLEHETALFLLVNLLDFFMTYLMLAHRRPDGGAYFVEHNPLAAYFLYGWGPIKGMLLFKLAIVLGVCLLVQLIALRNFGWARSVLNVGTAVVAAVVVYSLVLLLRVVP